MTSWLGGACNRPRSDGAGLAIAWVFPGRRDRTRRMWRSGVLACALASVGIAGPVAQSAGKAETTTAGVERAEPRANIPPLPLASPAKERRRRLGAVRSWRYQLRRIDTAEIAGSDADLVVIDYAPDRVYGVELPFTREDVARMRAKPGGGRKLLLAYLSIGEAERYRTYWQNAWYDAPTRPSWLLRPNPQWDGNFPVCFWNPEWQRIIFGSADAYLDRILAAGFDGIYLDRADVFQELTGERPAAERDMADFIVRLAAHARAIKPDALIVMQNAEELVRRRDVRTSIDGLAKEDLLFGVNHDEAPNPPDMVRDTLADLALARTSGLKVLVVEYLSKATVAQRAQQRISKLGYVPLIAERSLGTFLHVPQDGPALPSSAAEREGAR